MYSLATYFCGLLLKLSAKADSVRSACTIVSKQPGAQFSAH